MRTLSQLLIAYIRILCRCLVPGSACGVILACLVVQIQAAVPGAEVTYQGQLLDAGVPANGTYDLRFGLFDADSGGEEVAAAVSWPAVAVTNGAFTVLLDFGAEAFNGEARWLEIGVRTGTNGFARLSPRQLLTAVPYAVRAQTAETATTMAATNLTGTIKDFQLPATLARLDTDALFAGAVGSPLFAGDHASLTGMDIAGHITLNAAHYPQSSVGGLFWTPDGSPVNEDESNPIGKIQVFEDWGFGSGNRTLLIGSRSIRLENGWFTKDGPAGYISLGNEDQIGGEIKINYTPLRVNAEGTGMARYDQPGQPFETGVGIPVLFAARGCDTNGNNFECAPGIQSHGVPQGRPAATYGPAGDVRGLGELWFHSGVPVSRNVPDYFDSYPGVMVGRMLTNGWDFRGKLIQERVIRCVDGPTYTLDCGQAYCFDLTLDGNVTFATTNWSGGAGNIETRVVFLHAGAADRTVAFPRRWRIASHSGDVAFPTLLKAFTGVRIRLENLGGGDARTVANFEWFDDNPQPDEDVDDFVTRSGLSPTVDQRRALDQLVGDLKGSGLWAKFDVIYPFIGNATTMQHNLKSSNYRITWSNPAPVCGAGGITGNGASAYGNTGYVPSAGSNWSASSASLVVYCGTQAPGDSHFLSVAGGGFRAGMGTYGAKLSTGGINNNMTPSYDLGADYRGLIVGSRTSRWMQRWSINGGSALENYQEVEGVPDRPFFVLARNLNGAPDFFSNINLRLVMLGAGLQPSEVELLQDIVHRFESMLGRAVD